jgi:hypothetical protein
MRDEHRTGGNLVRAAPIALLGTILALAAWPQTARAAVTHVVQPGESLWGIAVANNLTTRTVAVFNGLPEDALLIAGESIEVYYEIIDFVRALEGTAVAAVIRDKTDGGRSVWVSFNWAEQIDLDAALQQQEALQGVTEEGQLVVKTAVLEEVVDHWPGKMLRRAQVLHSGTIWLSELGLALSRVTPPPSS